MKRRYLVAAFRVATCLCASSLLASCTLIRYLQGSIEHEPVMPATPKVTVQDMASVSDVPDPMRYLHSPSIPVPKSQTALSQGIVVCSPATTGPSNADASFGDACSAWLQLVLGGQPDLGRSPAWYSVRRMALEYPAYPNLRIPPNIAPAVGKRLGVTCVAVSTLSEAGGVYTLDYSLIDPNAGSSIGDDVQIKGTRDQIVAGLPATATEIARRLGIKAAPASASLGLSPDDADFVGRMIWSSDISDADRSRLASLTDKSALAAFAGIGLKSYWSDGQTLHAADSALAALSENAQVYGALAPNSPDLLDHYHARILSDADKYPANYLYAYARTKMLRQDPKEASQSLAISSAYQAVSHDPSSADAWSMAAATFGDAAETIRHSRGADELTAAQTEKTQILYAAQLACVENAVRLDPANSHSWSAVGWAAMFADDEPEADAACRHCLHMDQDKKDAFELALQLYQDKWYSDRAKLKAIARIVANDQTLAVDDQLDVANSAPPLGPDGCHDLIYDAIVRRIEHDVDSAPDDAHLHLMLGAGCQDLNLQKDARFQYEEAVRLNPNNPEAHVWLGDLVYNMDQHDEAMQNYQAAAQLVPDYPSLHFDIGYCYKAQNRLREATAEFLKEAAYHPKFSSAYYGLAAVYEMQGRNPEAADMLYKSARLDPWSEEAWSSLAIMLDRNKQYSQALQAIAEAQTYFPDDGSLITTQEDVYLNLRKPETTLLLCGEDLAFDKSAVSVACSHENIAEAYMQQGKIADAKTEWRKVTAMGDGHVADVAQAYLRKYGG